MNETLCYVTSPYLWVTFLTGIGVGTCVGLAITSLLLANHEQRSRGDFEMLKHLRDNEGKAVRN